MHSSMLNLNTLERGLKEALDVKYVDKEAKLLVCIQQQSINYQLNFYKKILLDFYIFMERLSEESEKEIEKSRKGKSVIGQLENPEVIHVGTAHVDRCAKVN